MSVITVFGGAFCHREIILEKIIKKTGYKLIRDQDVTVKASKLSGIKENRIKKAFLDKTSIFNTFTHEKEKSLAFLKLAVAEILNEDNLLIYGYSGLLIPKAVTHVLRICIIADINYRIDIGKKEKGISRTAALSEIQKEDSQQAAWVNRLFKINDPWDASLYDILVPADKMDLDEITELIDDNLKNEILKPTEASKKAAIDFALAANVEKTLAMEGHSVDVSARDGLITITINTNVIMLEKLEKELKNIAVKVPGVKSVETRVGKGFHQNDVYRKYDFNMPSKVLLVDDERKFVQTLSERLQMRAMGSAVAYDGESALNMVKEDDPEVMILDLKMPGIDGVEVLKKVKQTKPEVEVIILTGHGSEKDKELCMKLGAFAYLNKPVNIDALSDTLKKAYGKFRNQNTEK